MFLNLGNLVIEEAKIAKNIDMKSHPEIILQVQLYGWLLEKMTGVRPSSLRVFNSERDLVEVPPAGEEELLAALEDIVRSITAEEEPYAPVSYSSCMSCGFGDYCWENAVARRDVALLPRLDKGLARELRGMGIISVDDLVERMDEQSLSELKRPYGKGLRKVGKLAESIIPLAKALAEEREVVAGSLELPESPNYVMFDLEGLPPHLEGPPVYLWGMQVFGKEPSEYISALAGFGEDGDRAGWEDFLSKASDILARYGDIPFVHWATYEKTKLRDYMERFGDDSNGTAARVAENLFDLLPATRSFIALPIPSYSLKVIEEYVGFNRTIECKGDKSIAMYLTAIRIGDEAERQRIIDEILAYNREDLEATWAVLQWLIRKSSGQS